MMSVIQLGTMAVTVCLLAAAVAFPAPMAAPMGSYCGSYTGYVDDLNMTVANNQTFSITAKVIGVKVGCKTEAYTYYPSNSSFNFPGIFNSSDCIGKIAADAGLDPTGFAATYVASDDTINIQVEGVSINFDKKQCSQAINQLA
eukprot:m.411146 g.411146  ORF g.411146 m.411146 type:complete len:144 (+) comp28579_c0_seq1:1213-1644(+)